MILSSRALAALTLLLGLSAVSLAFFLAGDRPTAADSLAVPSATDPNVRSAATRPGTSATAGVRSRPAPSLHTSGPSSVTVPTSPTRATRASAAGSSTWSSRTRR